MSENYQMRIWQDGATYYAEVRELGLVASDRDLIAVVNRAEEEKRSRLEKYAAADCTPPLPLKDGPEKHMNQSRWHKEIGMFLLKTVFVVAIVVVGILVVGRYTVEEARSVASALQVSDSFRASGGPLVSLSKFADTVEGLPEERREEALDDVEAIVEALMPFVDRIRPLYCQVEGHRDSASD